MMLSKSKLLAYRQCPKRLWLELHRKDLAVYAQATQAVFAAGNLVGELATRLYDPDQAGQTFKVERGQIDAVLALTQAALPLRKPIFEAGFSAAGALAFADVLLPVKHKGKRAWRMVEVKSSTKVADIYHDDVAIQSFVARQSGLLLASVALAHIDKTFVYAGYGDYQGLLVEHDLTEEAFAREDEVRGWIAAAQTTARKRTEPRIRTGEQCSKPYGCAFLAYCAGQEPPAAFPVQWLPRVQAKALKTKLAEPDVIDLRDVPDTLLNPQQLRVKSHTLSGKVYFDKATSASALAGHKLPAYFLDFETISFAVPQWRGTEPFQAIPFQFSVHRLSRSLQLKHTPHLDLTGADPSTGLASALVKACGTSGPIFVYNKSFESTRIKELVVRLPKLGAALRAIDSRLVDLHPVVVDCYYHPSQQGSWSIKAVLPAMVPTLAYDQLQGVQDGGAAQASYLAAAFPQLQAANAQSTVPKTQAQIKAQLLAYCRLDTFAMVKIWAKLSGCNEASSLTDSQ